jgi:hypothetical protein
MSWDHRYYEATCRQCGAKGFKIYSADDWNRSEISWKGFTPFRDFPRYEYLVKRKKIDANQYAQCACGSTDIEVGSAVVRPPSDDRENKASINRDRSDGNVGLGDDKLLA